MPCPLEGDTSRLAGVRYNADIENYNKFVIDVINELPFPVQVDDLYSISASFSREMYVDDTHFCKRAFDLIGDAVIKSILEAS